MVVNVSIKVATWNMTKKNIEEEILEEFKNEIYGEDDALFDRNGNNVSQQVENIIKQALSRHRQHILEEILKFVKERKQTLDVGFRVPGEKYKGLYDWEDLINYLTKLKDEDY